MGKFKLRLADLAFLLMGAVLLGCKPIGDEPQGSSGEFSSEGLAGVFNFDAVSGEMRFAPKTAEIQLEGYALAQVSGQDKIFANCADIFNHPEDSVVPSEYYFYRRYSVECYAAQQFSQGQASQDNAFSQSLITMLPELPAVLSPQIGEAQLYTDLKDKTLMQAFNAITVSENSANSISASYDGLDVDYDILGRKDLNGDGHEDVLLMMTYHIIEGSGRGTQLFALSKTRSTGPITVLWDYP